MPSMLTEAVPVRGRTGAKKNKKGVDASRVLKSLEQHILLPRRRRFGKEPRLIFVRCGKRTPLDRSIRIFRLDAGRL